jgi:tight adherence protein C
MSTVSLAGAISVALAVGLAAHLLVGRRTAPAAGTGDLTDLDGAFAVDGQDGGLRAGLARAGLEGVRARQVGWAATAALLSLLLVAASPEASTVGACTVFIVGAWYAPVLVARRRETRRRVAVDHELVDTMGELVMAVEVGLSLDAAMARYAQDNDTPLAVEFGHYLDLVRLGWRRPEAMDELVARNPTAVVHLFAAAANQNQRLGTPLAAVLRDQATTARRQRRQAFEEQAAKVPLKMIFPTVFCVLPVLMIVAVGPAALRLVDALPG